MVFRGILVVVGVALASNAMWLFVTTNLNTGVLLQFAVAGLLLAFGGVRGLAGSRWFAYPAIGLAAIAVLVSTLLAGFGLVDTATDDEDALIVLGAAVHGSAVSPSLAERLEVAVDYHNRNPAALIVVTGGQGPQEDVAEAVAARDYLLDRGVPAEAIVVEDKSTSTAENFQFARALLDSRLAKGYRVAFVTHEYHVWRASRSAASAGLDASHLHSTTRWYMWPSSYLRESAAALLALAD